MFTRNTDVINLLREFWQNYLREEESQIRTVSPTIISGPSGNKRDCHFGFNVWDRKYWFVSVYGILSCLDMNIYSSYFPSFWGHVKDLCAANSIRSHQ